MASAKLILGSRSLNDIKELQTDDTYQEIIPTDCHESAKASSLGFALSPAPLARGVCASQWGRKFHFTNGPSIEAEDAGDIHAGITL